MTLKAILFDLDDTLIDRSKSLLKYASCFVNHFADNLDFNQIDDAYQVIKKADGDGYRSRDEVFIELLQLFPWVKIPQISDIRNHWTSAFPQCSEAVTGMYNMMDTLKFQGIMLGIITNGGSVTQNSKIDVLDIRHYMKTIIVSEVVDVRKPDSKIFQMALEKLGVGSKEAWYVGDHPVNDILGSSSAGLTPVWVTGVHPWVKEYDEPQLQINSLEELLTLVEDRK
jgi:putative hydrolase of the HAD superfamily